MAGEPGELSWTLGENFVQRIFGNKLKRPPPVKNANAPNRSGRYEVILKERQRYFSARSLRAFKVLNGASTTNLLATIDGTLPPGSVCT